MWSDKWYDTVLWWNRENIEGSDLQLARNLPGETYKIMKSLIDWSSARDVNTRPSHTKRECKLVNQGIYSGPFSPLFVFLRSPYNLHALCKQGKVLMWILTDWDELIALSRNEKQWRVVNQRGECRGVKLTDLKMGIAQDKKSKNTTSEN